MESPGRQINLHHYQYYADVYIPFHGNDLSLKGHGFIGKGYHHLEWKEINFNYKQLLNWVHFIVCLTEFELQYSKIDILMDS